MSDMKKYELTNKPIKFYRRTLYQIRALRDFGNVKKGDLGGYVATEKNLSHDGDAWIGGDACVYDNAFVSGNALVYGYARIWADAQVFGNARISGEAGVHGRAVVYGNASIYGNAWVFANAQISDNAKIYDMAHVYDDAWVCGNAEIYGDARVHGDSCIYDNAEIYGDAHIYCDARVGRDANIEYTKHHMTFGSFGSRDATTTIYRATTGIRVCCGCFEGTLDEFRDRVKEIHGNNRYAKEYLAIADIAELRFGKKEEE